jgi:hypothetical protein
LKIRGRHRKKWWSLPGRTEEGEEKGESSFKCFLVFFKLQRQAAGRIWLVCVRWARDKGWGRGRNRVPSKLFAGDLQLKGALRLLRFYNCH